MLIFTPAHAAEKLADLKQKALAGDYQAQRNLAFGYSDKFSGQNKNPVLACAWRMVILTTEQADETDMSNYNTYCGKLPPGLLSIAQMKAELLLRRIDTLQQ
ncbi:hypothetical protein ACOTJQ_30830 [Achromobacter xylosoxidans]|uniref:hypothetical protein n=1 Tax=Alcaligenes xylosoxydans xylosoxydans TaxID=85698 RepID=UPI000735542C|nr:hypothetical protein [Achromobacter xylosoxidans]PNM90990.1 hypothetical protein AL490_019125 [Achromobacter xylosoxidans]